MRDKVSHPYKTTGKINFIYFNICLWTSNRKNILNCMVAKISQIQSAINSFVNSVLISTVVPKYFNLAILLKNLLAIMTFSFVLVIKHECIFTFLCLLLDQPLTKLLCVSLWYLCLHSIAQVRSLLLTDFIFW
jgi:hypothetical protein